MRFVLAGVYTFLSLVSSQLLASPSPLPISLDSVLSSFQLKLPSSPALSGMILFSALVGKNEHLFVLDLDGQRVRNVIFDAHNTSYPSWNPEGDNFIFVSDRSGNKEIYLAEWDGSNQERLTNNKVEDDHPSWAPDGRSIIFYSEEGAQEGSGNIFSLNLLTLQKEQITKFTGRNSTPHWSTDQLFIIYSTNRFWPGWDICQWSPTQKIESCILSGAQSYCRPNFSPDGTRIAFSSGSFSEIDIGIFNLKDGIESTLTRLPGKEYDITWSPQGNFLAYTAENGKEDHFDLYLTDIKQKSTLILSSPHSIRYPSWSASRTFELEAKRMRENQTSKLNIKE